jgi:hypothetical protein
MNILTLSIKQKFFDQIKSGEKKHEHREIRPNNSAKYCEFKTGGELVGARKYDRIKFVTGQYKGTRPSMEVEVKSAEVVFLTDENDELITYSENGIEYIAAEVDYTLGEIIGESLTNTNGTSKED